MKNASIAERVAAGAEWLDKRVEGWWRTDAPDPIRVTALDIEDDCRCVLGQVFGSYDSATSELNRDPYGLGFIWRTLEVSDDVQDEEIRALTAEWKRVITERRETAVLA